jgi:TPR repeat protein
MNSEAQVNSETIFFAAVVVAARGKTERKQMNPIDPIERKQLLSLTKLALAHSSKQDHSHRLQLAEAGNVRSMVELAYATFDAGNEKVSILWILEAEASLDANEDLDGRSGLISAYNLGYGPGTLDQQQMRAIFHLEKLAVAGNTYAQEELALRYEHGLNGCPVDFSRAQYWRTLNE